MDHGFNESTTCHNPISFSLSSPMPISTYHQHMDHGFNESHVIFLSSRYDKSVYVLSQPYSWTMASMNQPHVTIPYLSASLLQCLSRHTTSIWTMVSMNHMSYSYLRGMINRYISYLNLIHKQCLLRQHNTVWFCAWMTCYIHSLSSR